MKQMLLGLLALTVLAAASPADVTYLPADQVAAAFAKGAPLVEVANYKIHASRRDAAGQVEIHEKDTDIIHVLTGAATLVTGGTVVGGKAVAAEEIRGADVEGGETCVTLAGSWLVLRWLRARDCTWAGIEVRGDDVRVERIVAEGNAAGVFVAADASRAAVVRSRLVDNDRMSRLTADVPEDDSGAFGVLLAFLSHAAVTTELTEVIGRLSPTYDESEVDALVDVVYWTSLAGMGIVVAVEAALLAFMMNRRGGARWLLLIALVLQGGVVLMGSAFLAVGGAAVATGIWRLRGHPAIPVGDPELRASLEYSRP